MTLACSHHGDKSVIIWGVMRATKGARMTRQQAVMAEARARVRGDGGETFIVVATNPAGARIETEAVAAHDARHFAFDLRMNGYTNIETVNAKEWA